jgi:transcriptional regulator with XRE-family HTH domain
MDNNSSKENPQLDEYLNLRGVSRAELARMSGVSAETIKGWVSGKKPSFLAVIRISAALGVPLKELAKVLHPNEASLDRVPDDAPDRDRVDEMKAELMEVMNRY